MHRFQEFLGIGYGNGAFEGIGVPSEETEFFPNEVVCMTVVDGAVFSEEDVFVPLESLRFLHEHFPDKNMNHAPLTVYMDNQSTARVPLGSHKPAFYPMGECVTFRGLHMMDTGYRINTPVVGDVVVSI